jgi:hypothetical protein
MGLGGGTKAHKGEGDLRQCQKKPRWHGLPAARWLAHAFLVGFWGEGGGGGARIPGPFESPGSRIHLQLASMIYSYKSKSISCAGYTVKLEEAIDQQCIVIKQRQHSCGESNRNHSN